MYIDVMSPSPGVRRIFFEHPYVWSTVGTPETRHYLHIQASLHEGHIYSVLQLSRCTVRTARTCAWQMRKRNALDEVTLVVNKV